MWLSKTHASACCCQLCQRALIPDLIGIFDGRETAACSLTLSAPKYNNVKLSDGHDLTSPDATATASCWPSTVTMLLQTAM